MCPFKKSPDQPSDILLRTSELKSSARVRSATAISRECRIHASLKSPSYTSQMNACKKGQKFYLPNLSLARSERLISAPMQQSRMMPHLTLEHPLNTVRKAQVAPSERLASEGYVSYGQKVELDSNGLPRIQNSSRPRFSNMGFNDLYRPRKVSNSARINSFNT